MYIVICIPTYTYKLISYCKFLILFTFLSGTRFSKTVENVIFTKNVNTVDGTCVVCDVWQMECHVCIMVDGKALCADYITQNLLGMWQMLCHLAPELLYMIKLKHALTYIFEIYIICYPPVPTQMWGAAHQQLKHTTGITPWQLWPGCEELRHPYGQVAQ